MVVSKLYFNGVNFSRDASIICVFVIPTLIVTLGF